MKGNWAIPVLASVLILFSFGIPSAYASNCSLTPLSQSDTVGSILTYELLCTGGFNVNTVFPVIIRNESCDPPFVSITIPDRTHTVPFTFTLRLSSDTAGDYDCLVDAIVPIGSRGDQQTERLSFTATFTCRDSDGDGVCDSDDICPAGDDSSDADLDGVPDACDVCPLDNPDDSDGDGVCDSDDICLGDDASGDSDGDGFCAGPFDCNDNNGGVNTGASEICGDLVDNDCDGSVDNPEICEVCEFVCQEQLESALTTCSDNRLADGNVCSGLADFGRFLCDFQRDSFPTCQSIWEDGITTCIRDFPFGPLRSACFFLNDQELAECRASGFDPFRECNIDVSIAFNTCIEGVDGTESTCNNNAQSEFDSCTLRCEPECTSDVQCADGDVCNGIEICDLDTGLCRLGSAPNCDDSNVCTIDSCDAITGCTNDAAAANGISCGSSLVCQDSACIPVDECPADPGKTSPGICGCGIPDTDSDLDGTVDCNDICPADPSKISVGICGCGISDNDSDADGVADCNDVCSGFDDLADFDGDGTPDGCDVCADGDDALDADSDGIPDACDDTPDGGDRKKSCDALEKAENKGKGKHKGIPIAKENNNC